MINISAPIHHYSDQPVASVRSVAQTPGRHAKPDGFWISIEDGSGWSQWCEQESYPIGSICHVVKLVSSADILHLQSCDDIDAFTRRYGTPFSDAPAPFYDIDWTAVAGRHDGIIIAPYQWGRRLHHATRWYYGWDVSGGCIWNAAAIANITPVAQAVAA